MKEKIAYILYTKNENDYKRIQNDRFYIVIAKYNPKKTTIILGERFDTIYCDLAFTKLDNGENIIKNIIYPLCKKFYLI